MSTLAYTFRDSATMLRRDLTHSLRNPMMTIGSLGMPIIMLLLFVYVFGGAMGGMPDGGAYINYVIPGIIVMTVGSGCGATAISVNADMTEGVIARFRTMAIGRISVLTGHVIGNWIRTMVSVALLFGVGLLMGFEPKASFVGWLAVAGVVGLLVFALTWLSVALGMVTKTPGGANVSTMLFWLLPFTSSTFVRTETMPSGVRWFAENQPFTSIIESLRGLLMGTPVGNNAIIGAAWCVALSLAGYLWAKKLYNRDPAR